MRGLAEGCVKNARRETADDLSSNGTLVVACSAAMFTLLPIAAHQLGWLGHLPDPPGKLFASDKITESGAAHPWGIPDSLLGLGSYIVTLALAVNAPRRQGVQKALALKLLADGSFAGFNLIRQVVSFRRLCSWCTGTALCTAAMLLSERTAMRRQVGIMLEQIDLSSGSFACCRCRCFS